MNVKDIMSHEVTTVAPDMTIRDLAALMAERAVSGVPVVDERGHMVGIVSEGDLIRRTEIGTDQKHSGWLSFFAGTESKALDFIKTHGTHARDVMTRNVATVKPDTNIAEAALLMEKRHVKRLPVVDGDRLVGIVSRADILRALAAHTKLATPAGVEDDRAIRERLTRELADADWAASAMVNVIVADGVVHLWGVVDSNEQKRAIQVAAESIPGVSAVENHLTRSLPT